jgi:hypothetical protein
MSGAGLYLDSEWTVASIVSGGILLAAAVCAGALAVVLCRRRRIEWPVAGLGLFFAYMAVDELFELHERLDVWFGPAGVVLFAPILLTGFVLWCLTRQRLDGISRHLFTLAAATWVGSQMLELVANPPAGAGVGRGLFVYPEEVGEAAGSAMFVIAIAIAVLPHLSPTRMRLPWRIGRRQRANAFVWTQA